MSDRPPVVRASWRSYWLTLLSVWIPTAIGATLLIGAADVPDGVASLVGGGASLLGIFAGTGLWLLLTDR